MGGSALDPAVLSRHGAGAPAQWVPPGAVAWFTHIGLPLAVALPVWHG